METGLHQEAMTGLFKFGTPLHGASSAKTIATKQLFGHSLGRQIACTLHREARMPMYKYGKPYWGIFASPILGIMIGCEA